MKTELPIAASQYPTLPDLQARIAAHPFLRGLRADHLATLAIYSMESTFAAEECIFREGEIANRFYLIEQGRVALEVRVNNRDSVLIETVGAGEVLGWSWLFPPYTWHFDARVVEPVKAIFFYGTRLRERCEADSALGHVLYERVAEVAIERLNAIRRRLVEVSKTAKS